MYFCVCLVYVREKERENERDSEFVFACPSLCLCVIVSDTLPQTVVQHLRWIMQKDLLGQDVFLIGPPGPLRRSIAMKYLVNTNTHTHSTSPLSNQIKF